MFLITLLAGLEWLYYVVLPVVGAIILLFVILTIIKAYKKKHFLKQREEENLEVITLVGGRDNIISASSNGSRLSLVLKNYDLVENEKLKDVGVSTVIKMSNKLTLVIGEDAEKIAKIISSSDKSH